MSQPRVVLLVRMKSSLSVDEIQKVVDSRIDQFRALDGLKQKYYLRDPASGDIAGLYLWESTDALTEFRESELRQTIAKAYQVVGEPRVEVYDIFDVLRD